MNYQEFKNDYLNLCKYFGRDTNRKIKNDLKKDAKELEYKIDYLKPILEVKSITYLYGELHTKRDISMLEQELKFTNQLISEL